LTLRIDTQGGITGDNMTLKKKLEYASNLLEEANESFTKNHFSKVEKAKSIIDEVIGEEEYLLNRED